MKKLVLLLFLLLPIQSTFCMELSASKKQQVYARKVDPRDENFFWLYVCDDECKEFRTPASISREAAKFMRCLSSKVPEKGMRRDNRLVLSITLAQWRRIVACYEAIRKEDFELLRVEILDGLTIKEFADLLLYAKWLGFEELVAHGGKEFIEKFKSEHITSFVQRGMSFLNNNVFVTLNSQEGKINRPLTYMDESGKYRPIDWGRVVEELKARIASFILDDEVQNEIRSNLKLALTCQGEVNGSETDRRGNYVGLYGSVGEEGFCEFREISSGKLLRNCKEENPVRGLLFQSSPELMTVNSQGMNSYCLFQTDDTLKPISTFSFEGLDALAQSADLSKVAYGGSSAIIVLDNHVRVFKTHESRSASKIVHLAFLTNYPILVEMKEGGRIEFWNYETGKSQGSSDSHQDTVLTYRLNKAGIITVSREGRAIAWTFKEDMEDRTLTLESLWDQSFANARPLCLNKNGTKLLLGNERGGTIFELSAEKELPRVNLYNNYPVVDGCFGRDNILATLSSNNRLVFWNPDEGVRLTQICLDKPVQGLKFIPDGSCLVTIHSHGAVTLWYYSDEKIVEYLQQKLNFEQALLMYAWKGYADVFNENADLAKIADTLDAKFVGKFLADLLPRKGNDENHV